MEILDSDFLAFQDGDPKLFERIYYKYNKEVYNYCYRFMENQKDTQDVTADTFTQLWNKKATINSLTGIPGFIFVTAKNICLQLLAKKGREKDIRHWRDNNYLEESIAADRTFSPLNRVEAHVDEILLEAIQAEIKRLPKQSKQVFQLLFIEQKSPMEIAEIMNISRSTVDGHKKEAIRKIKEAIEKGLPFLLIMITIGLCLFFF